MPREDRKMMIMIIMKEMLFVNIMMKRVWERWHFLMTRDE